MSIRESIIDEAKKYLDYTEGPNNDTIFGDWYGLPNQPWCAMFVSHTMVKAGVSEEIAPSFASCTAGFNKFKEMGIATRDHITPQLGDIIFFIWRKGEPTPDHVGFVEYVEGNKVHTIEGNRSDKVQRFEYDINSWQIYGYATPKYEDSQEEPKQDSIIKTVTVRVNSVLRIRQLPTTASTILATFSNGSKVDIYEIQGNWGRCSAGWICLDYTEEYKPETEKTGYVLGLYQVNTPSGLNVRENPVNGHILKAYINGTRFDTYEIQNNWARTPSGWVCLDYCKLVREY